MKYAVIQLQGKQYRVSEGELLTVDRLEAEAGKDLTIADVLLVNTDGQVQVGTPLVAGSSVTLRVEEHGLDEKIRVCKYKPKSKYRKTHGHRQQVTNVRVQKIA